MADILKLAAVFATMLALIRLKWQIGYVLTISSALLALLYLMPLPVMLDTLKTTLIDPVTIELFLALTLIRILEMILRERQVLSRMTEAVKHLLKGKKMVVISMPLLIGLLPSIGGAYFSAPMVDEASKDLRMSQEDKAFANYWYRHPWEYVLPLYPGLLLAAAISHIELRSLIIANTAFAVIMFFAGFIFTMRAVTDKPETKTSAGKQDSKEQDGFRFSMLKSFSPVIIVLALVMVFNVPLFYALLTVILGLIVIYRFSFKDIVRGLKYGFTTEVITLIFGVMLFKFTMENSGAVVNLSAYFAKEGIPLLYILFLLPFLCGLLTGFTVGFIGGTFPLIISLSGGMHLNEIVFAFSAGYIGVLLSPVHVCFVLTRQYFKANIWGFYRKVIPACCIILAAVFAEYFIL
jgi:uncharacterized protein